MSWDDDDFEVSASNNAAASWEEEGDDEALLDSWDVDPDEVEKQKKEAEAKKAAEKAALKKKQEEQKLKKKGMLSDQTLAELDNLDEQTRKDLLKQAELNADLNNAADLFAGLGVAEDINAHPRERITKEQIEAAQAKRAGKVLTKDTPLEEHPLFLPATKQEYEKLRKALAASLVQMLEDNAMLYALSLAIDLIRDIAQPLSLENTRKLQLTLNVMVKEKERAERQARLKKTGGTATGGAGKKKAKPAVRPNVSGFKKDEFDDMDDAQFDDFGDDDFM